MALRELAGWESDDEVIRWLTHATAGRGGRADAGRFAAAAGDTEVQVDAGKVNTLGGWRDVRLAVFARREAGRSALLSGGKVGVEGWVGAAFGSRPAGASGDELRALAGYFAAHPTRLGYRERLASGRSIGSGLVEGSVKHLVNRRLKLTGCRWRVDHVGPLVELASIIDTQAWQEFWTAARHVPTSTGIPPPRFGCATGSRRSDQLFSRPPEPSRGAAMPTGTFEYRDDAERAAIERAIAFVAEMRDLAHAAPAGHVLDWCEAHALDAGRDLLRDTLARAAQARIDDAEQKKGRPGRARAGAGSAGSGGAAGAW